ncbi:phosphotransferase [Streptacidiphilus jiangxiensis]|uniref:Phosphotransferase enzyme family protein n=1 Tax=Streptacidiphilus jiangxiensis TaxID=235985 RepID=A0A1H7IZF1_STRJI|nr:phosphotransferase [Streptacidiphilus jiangxiensis]SEK66205.1 Phosphotransferase enzyme family protein [Streptacidiphilus jiangxiensis]
MALMPPASRPAWEALSQVLRAAIEDRVGGRVSVVDYPSGGFTPGIAARLELDCGARVFIKGIALDDPASRMYRAEAAVGADLPVRVAPALLWAVEEANWLVLGFEDVSGSTPDLAPGSADLDGVLETVAALAPALTPCPAKEADAFAGLAGTLAGYWRRLEAQGVQGWDARHVAELTALDSEEVLVRATQGDTLLHCDLRADNMLVEAGRARVIDWSWFARGAAWVDVAFLLPQLILAGHRAPDADRLLAAAVPAWAQAPEEGVVAFAVAITGFWEWQQRSGPGGALGAYRGRAAAAGRAWVAHRMGWKEPASVPL